MSFELREQGFSLIETLIAATIVVLALVALAQMTVLSISANQGARSRTIATLLARDKIEEVLASDEEVAAGVDFFDARGRPTGAGALPPPGTVFVRRWTADPMPANPAAAVVQVWITLLHDAGGVDAARIVSLKTSRRP